MNESANLITSIAALLGSVAWPIALIVIVAMLKAQIVELFSRVENLNMGDKSIKFRQAAIWAVDDAVEQLGDSHSVDEVVVSVSPIEESMKELIDDDPREAVQRQWDRVGRAIILLASEHGLHVDLRSMNRTAATLRKHELISDELAAALPELYKTCKYARRVYEFDLPRKTVEDFVRATDEAIQALKQSTRKI